MSECGTNLPFCEKSTPESLERIRFATLKLSKGSIRQLRESVDLAKMDWRDALVAAGFAESLTAHIEWVPKKQ